jgi:SpoVK/Ycf46/Vps4 family AAA+-type ATPase
MSGNQAEIEIFATTPTRAQKAAKAISEELHYREVVENFVEFKIWNSEESRRRRMKEQKWESIRENYPTGTREKLTRLMALQQAEPRGGKIIIWHGEPGTGKTNALRALMTEWKWAQSEIITDPESLLVRTDYLNQMIESSTQNGATRLLIIEDSDSLLSTNVTSSRSPGMARLLNVADGILGINQDLIILFTTNAPPSQLDAALSRPGRCLAHIKFGRFEPTEIKQLFGEDIPNPKSSMTLAEIWGHRYEQVNIFDDSHPSNQGQYL